MASSLYLRQHAANPVHWQQWSDAAWERARTDHKPVLISIGYSACHWCHVMEHESFEDAEVAAIMNEAPAFAGFSINRLTQLYVVPYSLGIGEPGGKS